MPCMFYCIWRLVFLALFPGNFTPNSCNKVSEVFNTFSGQTINSEFPITWTKLLFTTTGPDMRSRGFCIPGPEH